MPIAIVIAKQLQEKITLMELKQATITSHLKAV